jgi:hypothetical protein
MVISDEQLAGFEEVAIAFLDLVRCLRQATPTLRTQTELDESATPHWVTLKEAVGYSNGRFKDVRKLKAIVDEIYYDPDFITNPIRNRHCERITTSKGRHYYKVLVPTFFEVL